jgi:hypothetical protein
MIGLLRASFFVVAVPTAYGIVAIQVGKVYPKIGHVLVTIAGAIVYGFVGTVAAAVFIGAHYAVFLFIPIALLSTRSVWRYTKPDPPSGVEHAERRDGTEWTSR